MNIKNMPIGEIRPYKNNPRHNDNAVDIVARSIKEFGFKVPVIIDKKNVVVCGHTRLKAAVKLGLTTVPCVVADDLTEAQIKAFRLAENRTHEYAEWDEHKLKTELEELSGTSFDIATIGFEGTIFNSEACDIDELLKEYEIKVAVKQPIWAVIRTEKENEQVIEKALSALPGHIRIERSYG